MASETEAGQAADRRPEPRIDHVMVLVDAAAYEEMATSGFLGERFCRLKDKRADSSVAGRYSTLGVAGDNSLIELFNADMPGSAGLTGGLVFSFEEPGSASAARALLDRPGHPNYHYDLVKRAVEGDPEQLPWYHLISIDLGAGSPLLLFLNEVTPEYLSAVGGQPAEDGTLRRRDYLNAVLGTPADGSRLMRDITEVTLVVNAQRGDRIAQALAVFGFTVARNLEHVELRGPDLTLHLRIDEAAVQRITDIRMRISGGEKPAEFRFGTSSRLTIEADDTARWIFEHAD